MLMIIILSITLIMITCANHGNNVTYSYDHIMIRQSITQNPKMMWLSKKGAHGVSARCEEVCMPLPQRYQGSTLVIFLLFIANSTSVALAYVSHRYVM